MTSLWVQAVERKGIPTVQLLASSFAERLMLTATVCEERGACRQCLKLLHRRMYFIAIRSFSNRLIGPRFQWEVMHVKITLHHVVFVRYYNVLVSWNL